MRQQPDSIGVLGGLEMSGHLLLIQTTARIA